MRYLMTFSYDGTNFNGYQKQDNCRTIQSEIEKCLAKINSDKEVTIHASGRTDAHVHALNQKAHFDLKKEIEPSKLRHSLNQLLPSDIYVKDIVNVDNEFHARYNVKEKTYIYKINLGEYDPIECNYVYQYNKQLNIDAMKKALKLLEGEHNFKSFTKASDEKDNYVRTIYKTDLVFEDDKMTIMFKGNGFLRYMIRNMVGTLIEIGEGKIDYSEIVKILDDEDRTSAGITASACGLYLKDVLY